jgi:hypothetical protein
MAVVKIRPFVDLERQSLACLPFSMKFVLARWPW